ncbi:MAG: hypothetical protein ABIN55_12600, partial [Aeromicrobium sp.]
MRAKLENSGGLRIRGVVAALAMATAASAVTLPAAMADTPADACTWKDASKAPEVRAQELITAMTLDDKVAMVTGIGILNPNSPNKGASGVIPGNPKLCIPDL